MKALHDTSDSLVGCPAFGRQLPQRYVRPVFDAFRHFSFNGAEASSGIDGVTSGAKVELTIRNPLGPASVAGY